MRRLIFYATALIVAYVPQTLAHAAFIVAQSSPSAGWQTAACGDDHTRNHWSDQFHVCELRHTTFNLGGGHLGVNTENGGIDVIGEDRGDIAVEARVEAWAGSQTEATDLLHQVEIEISGDQIHDHAPGVWHFRRSGYAVSYRLHVPRRLAVDLQTRNGGIEIAHLEGDIHFDTTNGGVALNDLAGNVDGRTVNGGLEINLTGDRWQGQGLHADTTNGGVEIRVPEHYNAHLETGTVNGGISIHFPVTVQGSIKNHLSTDIGTGGSVVHAETINGGIQISHT